MTMMAVVWSDLSLSNAQGLSKEMLIQLICGSILCIWPNRLNRILTSYGLVSLDH